MWNGDHFEPIAAAAQSFAVAVGLTLYRFLPFHVACDLFKPEKMDFRLARLTFDLYSQSLAGGTSGGLSEPYMDI